MMNCPDSLAPDDEELLRYALDEDPLSDETRAHLERCELCQQRLASYQQTHSLLLSHLYRRQCPNGTQLSLYCAGLLPMDEQIHVATHLLGCPLCSAEAAETRRFLAQVEPLPVPSPAASSLSHTIRRIFATLVTPPLESNLVKRGSVPTTEWPRQYQAESVNLSLHLSRNSKKEYVLLAIMTSTEPAVSIDAFEGVVAELYTVQRAGGERSEDKSQHMFAESPTARTQVDDTGNMVFRAVPRGNYTLVVHLPGHELVIEEVTIASG